MLVGRHDHAQLRAGIDIDVRVNAALADEFEIVQAFEQRRANFRSFPDQHQDLGVAEAFGKRVGVLDVVIPDGDFVSRELGEALQGTHAVVVVIQDGDLHAPLPRGVQDGGRKSRNFPFG